MLNRIRSSGRKVGGVLAGVFFGLALFVGSVVLLWVNEGRTDLSKIARRATPVAPDRAGSEAQGLLVAITGEPVVEGPARDPLTGASGSGDYLMLQRTVEVYAWKERQGENDTYAYETEWTSSPADSSRFEYPLGHTNPPLPFPSETFYADRASIGNLTFDPERLRHLPAAEPIPFPQQSDLPAGLYLSGTYLYSRHGAWNSPQVGDVRISYTAVPADETVSTLYGLLQGDRIEPYLDDGDVLYGLWRGNHDEAMATMHQAYLFQGWMMRIGGLLMMWIAFTLMLGPLTALLGGIPLLGNLGRGLIWLVTLLVALALTIVIVVVSFIVHRWYLLLLLLVALAGLFVYLHRRRQQREGAAAG